MEQDRTLQNKAKHGTARQGKREGKVREKANRQNKR
jgi:hypothetical protein